MNTDRRGFLGTIAKTLLTISIAGAAGSPPVEARLQEFRFPESALRKYRWSDRPEQEFDDIGEAYASRGLSLVDLCSKPKGDVCRIYVSDTSKVRAFAGLPPRGGVLSPVPPDYLYDLSFLNQIHVS